MMFLKLPFLATLVAQHSEGGFRKCPVQRFLLKISPLLIPIGEVLTSGSVSGFSKWDHGGRSCYHQESAQLPADEEGRGGN